MKKSSDKQNLTALRHKAQQAIHNKTAKLRKVVPPDERKLVHEFETYQIELEMQNEQLRRTQQELEESQRRFAALYDFAPVGYFVFDRKGVILSSNLTGAHMLGKTKDLLIGLPFSAIVFKEDLSDFFEHLREVFERQVKQVREVRLLKADNSLIHVQLQTVISDEKDGQSACCHTAIIDISERKQAEEALLESEERFRGVFDTATVGIAIVDADGRFLQTNQAFQGTTGYTSDELNSITVADLTYQADYETEKAHIDRARAGDVPNYQIEKRYVRKDGRIIWVQLSSSVIRDRSGNVMAVGVITDITERKRAEEMLRASEERFRMLFERAGDAIFLLQAEGEDAGRILAANQAAADMHGCTLDDLTRMKITELDAPDTAREAPAMIQRILGGEWIKREITHRRKDGRVFPVEISAGMIQYGGQRYILALDRDITERKQAEEEINELNKELAYHIHELNAANKELEAFIYSVSHDLRAPLRIIAGFSDLLSLRYSDNLDQMGKEYLDRVVQGTEKMNLIIDELLSLSRISRKDVQKQQLDLSAMAGTVVRSLRDANPDRRVAVDIKAGITAFADPGLIEVALSNLLGNAWKFTSKKDNARIELGMFIRDGKNVYYVKDNGAGFDQTRADRLFLPFHRLHTEQEFEGTGIGLAITERVINRHGGTIWAEGKVNEGASFFFTLL